MSAVVVRIFLRYLAGILVAKGFLAPEDGLQIASDPDISMLLQVALGALVGALSESWYYVARKLGWER